MTLASMTGFARAAAEMPEGGLVWELRTVNGKGLDIRLRVPNRFDGEETRFRQRLGTVLNRGTCQASLSLSRPVPTAQVRVNQAMLSALVRAITEAVPPGVSVGPLSLDGLVAVPGLIDMVEPAESAEARGRMSEAAGDLLDRALADLQVAREGEGQALGVVLNRHLDRIESLIEAAEAAPGRKPEAIRERLERAVAHLAGQTPPLDPVRLHQEAVLLAARADIREEIDRLSMHHRASSTLLAQGGVVGRKLDFLAQELGREANTLCTKSNDAGLTTIGLDLRNTIEQFREQVQNLE